MPIQFVTLFPQAQDVHLRKGLGQIPNTLAKKYGYESTFVCFQNDTSYPSISSRAAKINMHFLKFPSKKQPLLASLLYILRNARKIDVLNIYGQSRWAFFVGYFFKLLNPSGALFLKLDMNIQYLEVLQKSKNLNRHLFFWSYYFEKVVDIVSSEYVSLTNALISFYKIDSDKIVQLPNGIDLTAILQLDFRRKSWKEKDNLILIVGRIGAPEKGHELIIDALPIINLNGFKVAFVGPIEPLFQNKIDTFFDKNPHLKSVVTFEGNVDNFKELATWYNKAKIFCMSSFREGFPVVLPEAMYWGCYIVSTNVSSISEILENGDLGTLIHDRNDFSETLELLLQNETSLAQVAKKSVEKAERYYEWTEIVNPLDKKIKQVICQ